MLCAGPRSSEDSPIRRYARGGRGRWEKVVVMAYGLWQRTPPILGVVGADAEPLPQRLAVSGRSE